MIALYTQDDVEIAVHRLAHFVRLGVVSDRAFRERLADAGRARSYHWPAVEHAHLIAHPFCAVCGTGKRLQVHHKKPFHLHPELELDPENLLTLCMGTLSCHLLFGHLGCWKTINPHVDADAHTWSLKISHRSAA